MQCIQFIYIWKALQHQAWIRGTILEGKLPDLINQKGHNNPTSVEANRRRRYRYQEWQDIIFTTRTGNDKGSYLQSMSKIKKNLRKNIQDQF